MRDRKAIGTGATIATLAAGLATYVSVAGGFGPRLERSPHQATGRVIAEEALKLLKSGGEIVVIGRDTTAFKNPASDVQMASFRQTISRAQAKINAVHTLQVDPLRPVEVPSGDFFELLRKTPPQDVIVSFMGPPLLSEAQRLQLGEVKPRVIAFCSGSIPQQIDLRSLFEQGLLQTAIVSKRNVAVSTQSVSGYRQCFDRCFTIITSENVSMLPPLQTTATP